MMYQSPIDAARAAAAARLFHPKVLRAVPRWLARLGIPKHDRDDVAGDVWLCTWLSWPTFDPGRARPERWMNRIAVHVCGHYHARASHRREVLLDCPLQVPDPSPDAFSLLEAEEIRIGVIDALNSLDLPERVVLIEHDLDEVPMDELAERRGMPLSTCYKWRARAFEAMRAKIAPRKAARM